MGNGHPCMYFWCFGKMYDPSLVLTRGDLALPEMVDDGSHRPHNATFPWAT